MKKLELHWQILIALIFAVLYGSLFPEAVQYVSWLGDIFLRALKMIIVPLILASIISGVTGIGNAENLGKLGIKTITYYIATSLLAIFVGLLLVNLIQPGVGADLGLSKQVEDLSAAKDSFGDTLIQIIPVNIFESFLKGDMLSIIFFSILFGFFITQTGETYRTPLTNFFDALFEVMMKITMFIIKFAPIGIFGIVARTISQQSDLIHLIQSMGLYMIAVLLGLFIHIAFTLPMLLKFIGRVNPRKHFHAVATPLITAFSTSSSNATLPLTIDAVKNNSGVSTKITSFTLPLGATINMDGTALYECIAAMFIAQAYGVELTFVQQMIVVITALLASIGAAGIPMAGLVTITIILSAVGLPLEGVGLILSVDRILDMCRTTVNVFSDTCGAVIIAKTEGETLKIE